MLSGTFSMQKGLTNIGHVDFSERTNNTESEDTNLYCCCKSLVNICVAAEYTSISGKKCGRMGCVSPQKWQPREDNGRQGVNWQAASQRARWEIRCQQSIFTSVPHQKHGCLFNIDQHLYMGMLGRQLWCIYREKKISVAEWWYIQDPRQCVSYLGQFAAFLACC